MKREDYHHGDLRRALVAGARALLDAQKRVSLRAVARAAGVSQAAPYRHFADKEALLAAVAEAGFGELTAAMRAHAAVPAPAERVQRMGVEYVKFAVANAALFRLMFGSQVDPVKHPGCAAAAHVAFAMLAGGVAEAVARGEFRGQAHDLTLVAWSLVHGLGTLLIEGQGRAAGLDPERADAVAERVTRAALVGLGA